MIKSFFAIAIGGAIGAAGLFAADRWMSPSEQLPRTAPWSDRFPNVQLQTHDGRTVNFYDDLIAGKTVAINFFYVGCLEF